MLCQYDPPAGLTPARSRTPALWGLLPAKLSALPATARAQLGLALDRGSVCFVRDAIDGEVLVAWAARL